MRALFVLTLSGCAATPANATTSPGSESGSPVDEPRQVEAEVAQHDIRLVGNDEPSASPTADAVDAVEPSARPFFGRSSGLGWNDDGAVIQPTLRALCKDLAHGKPNVICTPAELRASFEGKAPYVGLRAVFIKDETWSRHQLVLVTTTGVAPLPVFWDVVDPSSPGCPSFVDPHGLESARIERGLLVLTTLGTTIQTVPVDETKLPPEPEHGTEAEIIRWSLERNGIRTTLVRGLVVAKVEGDTLHARELPGPLYGGMFLAQKIPPRPGPFQDWAHLPWTNVAEYHVRDDGDLDVPDRDL